VQGWVFGVTAVAVFLVATWFARRRLAPTGNDVPRAWTWSGYLVWASMFLGGFSGLTAMAQPVTRNVTGVPGALLGGVLLGGMVSLLIWLGASLAFYADMDVWKWAVLYQVIAVAGDLGVGGTLRDPSFALLTIVPLCGLVALAVAFRNPPTPEPSASSKPARPEKRRS